MMAPALLPGSLRVVVHENWPMNGHDIYVIATRVDGVRVVQVEGEWEEMKEASAGEPSIRRSTMFLPEGGLDALARAVGYHVAEPSRELIDVLKGGVADARAIRDQLLAQLSRPRILHAPPPLDEP